MNYHRGRAKVLWIGCNVRFNLLHGIGTDLCCFTKILSHLVLRELWLGLDWVVVSKGRKVCVCVCVCVRGRSTVIKRGVEKEKARESGSGGRERERERDISVPHSLLHILFVFLDFIDIEQSCWWHVLAILKLCRWARINVCLRYHSEAGVHRGRLVDVENKVWILDDVHPEPKWNTATGWYTHCKFFNNDLQIVLN